MNSRTEKLSRAMEGIDTAYLEEALDFDGTKAGRRRTARFPRLSAACVAVLVILGLSVTAFAISRIPLSWRDIFSPGQMMSGAYVSSLLPRKECEPENELEGVVHADWQPGDSAKGLVIDIANWQEKRWFDDVKVDFNVAEMVENAGENAKLSKLQTSYKYLWQPGDADVKLPYGDLSICNAGWEDGELQLVMKGPVNENISAPENWYFIDTRTDTIIYPELGASYRTPDILDPNVTDTDWRYIWESVPVDKEALPYLELHWGGKYIFTTALPGCWKVTLDETPVTVQSEVLAENVPLSYAGETLLAKKIECSKLSMAVYFDGFVDSTADTWKFEIFDENGNLIPSNWGFIATQSEDSCMFLTEFDEPIEPETVCKLTFNGETVFER